MGEGKVYQVIYADPPWRYRHCESNNRTIENHYPTMDLEDIKKLNVPSDKNCVLYMWTTAPKLAEGLEVMVAWGFDYRSCLIWDKEVMGLGYWARIQHEILMVGVKGKISPPIPSLRIPSVVRIKRGQHSDKPDYFRAMIDKWFPNANKLEMFCRDHTPLFKRVGWHVWGNEVKNSLEIL